jgi:hypothetical protein
MIFSEKPKVAQSEFFEVATNIASRYLSPACMYRATRNGNYR